MKIRFKHSLVAMIVGLFAPIIVVASPPILTVETKTKNEKLVTEDGRSVDMQTIINIAEIPHQKSTDNVKDQSMLINWARRLLEAQWNQNPGVPVEIVVIPKADLQKNIEAMGNDIHSSTWLNRRRREYLAMKNQEVPRFEDRIQDELVWKHVYKYSPNEDEQRLPENIRPAYRFAKLLSTGNEHIIMGEPHRYNPQVENFWLTMVRTVVNGTIISTSLFVIANEVGIPGPEIASAVAPPAILTMMFSMGLQWHGHKIRVFLKKKKFGRSSENSHITTFLAKQLMITATFVTALRATMVHVGLADPMELAEFAQRVGTTTLTSVLFVGLSFGLILRDRTIVRNEHELSARDFKIMKQNNRITLMASFLSTFGETLMQSKSPALASLGSMELALVAGGAYTYWLAMSPLEGVANFRNGLRAAARGEVYEARQYFREMFKKSVRPPGPKICVGLFAH